MSRVDDCRWPRGIRGEGSQYASFGRPAPAHPAMVKVVPAEFARDLESDLAACQGELEALTARIGALAGLMADREADKDCSAFDRAAAKLIEGALLSLLSTMEKENK